MPKIYMYVWVLVRKEQTASIVMDVCSFTLISQNKYSKSCSFSKKTQVNDSSIVLSHGLHCKHYFSFSSPHQATHNITPPPDSDTKTIQIFSFFESYIMKTLEKHTVTFLFYVSFKCENRWIVQVRIAVFFFCAAAFMNE